MGGGDCRKSSQQAPAEKCTCMATPLLFPTMHEHPPVEIVPTISQSTHLFRKSEFIFCNRRIFFLFQKNSIYDGDLKNFLNGFTLKISITFHQFVLFSFHLRHKLDSNCMIVDITCSLCGHSQI